MFIVKLKVQPDIEKFVDTQARDEVDTKAVSSEVLARYVEVALEWSDTPAQRTFGN